MPQLQIMKKYTTLFFISLLAITFMSCGKDEPDAAGQEIIGFTIEDIDYSTPQAYLIFESAWVVDIATGEYLDIYQNAFRLFFSDSETIINDEDILIRTTTSNIAALAYESEEDDVSSIEEIGIGKLTYSLNDETVIAENLVEFEYLIDHSIGSKNYGRPNESEFHLIEDSGSGSLSIEQLNIDYSNLTGNIRCTYNVTDDNGVAIDGLYDGSIVVLVND